MRYRVVAAGPRHCPAVRQQRREKDRQRSQLAGKVRVSPMGLKSSGRATPTATFEELQAFRSKAIEVNMPSLATAALIGWEWLQVRCTSSPR